MLCSRAGRRLRVCGRCQPNRGGRQQAAFDPGSRMEQEACRQRNKPCGERDLATLDDAAFGAASEVTPKFVSPSDPAAQWTGAMRGPAFFAYADNYLIGRQVWHHHGCRGITRDPPSWGGRREGYDEAYRGSLRDQARAARGRYGLRLGGKSRLARQREEDCTAHPSDRQVKARGWHLQSGRLQIRQGTRRIHLPSRQDPADDGHVGNSMRRKRSPWRTATPRSNRKARI